MNNKDNFRESFLREANRSNTRSQDKRKLAELLESMPTDLIDGVKRFVESISVPTTISQESDNSVLYANIPFSLLIDVPPNDLVGVKASTFCCTPENQQWRDVIKRDGYIHNKIAHLKKSDGSIIRTLALGLPIKLYKYKDKGKSLFVCLHYPIDIDKPAAKIPGYDYTIYKKPIFESGDLKIYFDERRVFLGNREVFLSNTEYRLLAYLAHNAGSIMTPDELLSLVWGCKYAGARNLIETNIARIRHKLQDNSRSPNYIKTKIGQGYFLALYDRKP